MSKVLIVIDVQEDFTRGALRNKETIARLPNISTLVKFANDNDWKIIYTLDGHNEDYLETQEGKFLPVPHCIYGTKGQRLCLEVITHPFPTVVWKETFGSIQLPKLINELDEKTDEIYLCGFCTDICVSANFQILKAYYPEIPIVVVEDCCAGVTPELHEAAIKVMKSCQGYIKTLEEITNTEVLDAVYKKPL